MSDQERRELNRRLTEIRREAAAAQGKCIHCFKRDAEAGRSLCGECIDKKREADKITYRKRKLLNKSASA
jgi:uncharacterized protein Yka (UPF0111/DUF47 family)